jgi:hypothetical protein
MPHALDDVPWADLRHAYGPATDTPGLLARLAEGDVDDDTWEKLYSSIAHQGTVYSASARCAPFLIALTETLDDDDLLHVLGLLESIASGNAEDEATSKACTTAAEAGVERYLALLSHPSDDVREAAAQVLAHFSERVRESRAAFEAALDRDPDSVALLEAYVAAVDRADPEVRARLTTLTPSSNTAIAAIAALVLGEHCDVIVRELATPRGTLSPFDAREAVGELPESAHPAFFEAVIAGGQRAENHMRAFELGHALLWIAFRRRLGGPARKPRPFVFVASLEFPWPWDTGGGHPATLEKMGSVHWRDPKDRPPNLEWTCSPYLHTWDFPRPGFWKEPPRDGAGGMPGINIAEPVERASMTDEEVRAVETLVGWDNFWRVDSDLAMVYGLPASREALRTLLSGKPRRRSWWPFG